MPKSKTFTPNSKACNIQLQHRLKGGIDFIRPYQEGLFSLVFSPRPLFYYTKSYVKRRPRRRKKCFLYFVSSRPCLGQVFSLHTCSIIRTKKGGREARFIGIIGFMPLRTVHTFTLAVKFQFDRF